MASLLSTTVNGTLNSTGRITASYNGDRYQMNFYRASASNWWITNDSDRLGIHLNNVGDKFYFANDGDFWTAQSGWLSTSLSGKVSTSGGSTVGGITYFSNGESMQVYGIRGRFANEYIHLYNKVGIGNPNGWGEGQGSTPGYGLSTYGGAVFAYGNNATSTFYGHLRIDRNWGNGDYGAEQFTIRGTYPSIALRSTHHNSKWLIHNDDTLSFYYGGPVDDNSWARKFFIPTDGNIWMSWAGDYISNLLGAKQNASTAITTSNIGSQSVSYATSAGDASTLGGFGRGNTTNKVAYFDGTRNLFVNNPESYSGEVRLGAAWNRGGVYASSTLSMATSSGAIDFVSDNTTIGAFRWDSTNGTRFIVGQNVTTTPHTLIDSNRRPVIYSRGAYPVLTLDHTETSNGSHGPTIQFAHNGTATNNRQWVIGTNGTGTQLDFGYSEGGSNTSYNPHNGIGDYQGTTWMRIDSSGAVSKIGALSLRNGFTISQGGSDYGQFNSWVFLSGVHGFYSSVNGAHLYPNNGSYGSWRMSGARNGWNGIEFDASNGNVSLMANQNSNSSGFHNNAYGWQIEWTNGTLYCSKNAYGGGTQAAVLDSSNYTSYTLPRGGSWYGVNLPGARWGGFTTNGGEIVFGRDFPNNGQMGMLIDGCYTAGENNGFWSLPADNDWNGRIGFYNDGGGNATFNARVNTSAGYISNSNPWGTNNSAFFPNGITTAGSTNWVYGYTYIGNAPANGAGHEFSQGGDQYSTGSVRTPTFIVSSHSDNTKGYRIYNTSGTSVSAMFTNSSNALVIAAGAVDQINLNKKVYVNGVALGVNVAPSSTAGRIDASNDIVAYSSSDERLKYNITPIENAIDKVKSLTGVEFDWKPEYKHAHGYEGHDTGIIAQQVQEVVPSAVRTNDTGFLAVRYEKLIGLLIEANKELAARVEELEKKLG